MVGQTIGHAGYHRFARMVHWLTLLLIAAMIGTGYAATQLRPAGPMPPALIEKLMAGEEWPESPSPQGKLQDQVLDTHKSIGVIILFLTLIRLLYRLRTGVPAIDPAIPQWQRLAARVSHILLYAGLIVMPALGWYASSAIAANHGFMFFALFEMPPIAPPDFLKAAAALGVHRWLAWALLALIGVHAAAALYHHYVLRDGVLTAMLTGRARTKAG